MHKVARESGRGKKLLADLTFHQRADDWRNVPRSQASYGNAAHALAAKLSKALKMRMEEGKLTVTEALGVVHPPALGLFFLPSPSRGQELKKSPDRSRIRDGSPRCQTGRRRR